MDKLTYDGNIQEMGVLSAYIYIYAILSPKQGRLIFLVEARMLLMEHSKDIRKKYKEEETEEILRLLLIKNREDNVNGSSD